jgi:hypothetical protein
MKEERGKRGPGRPRGEPKVMVRVMLDLSLYEEVQRWREKSCVGLSALVSAALEKYLGREGK